MNTTCDRCGAPLLDGVGSCGRCGAALLATVPSKLIARTPEAVGPETYEATTSRSLLQAVIEDGSAAGPLATQSAPNESTPNETAPSEPAPVPPPAAAFGPPALKVVVPFDAAAPARSATPLEVWLVSAGLVTIAAIIADPVLRYGFPLLGHVFDSNAFVRAFDDLFLFLFVLLAATATGAVLLAVWLVRGSRVAQLITCGLSVAIGLSALIDSAQPGGGDEAGDATVPVVLVAICVGVVVLLTLPPGARQFFARDRDRPFGVLVASVITTYLGACSVISGMLLCLAASYGQKFVWWGIGFLVAGIALLAASRPVRQGNSTGRSIAVVGLVLYIVLGFVIGADQHATWSPSTIVPFALGLVAVGGLTTVASSTAHFAAGPGDSAASSRMRGGVGVLVLLAVVLVVVGFHASSTTPQFSAGGSDYAQIDSPSGGVGDLTSDQEQPSAAPIAAGRFVRAWTIEESSPDGDSAKAVLRVGTPQAYRDGLEIDGFAAGQACDLDPGDGDAVVPFRLSVINSGSSAADVGVTLDGVGGNSILGISGPVLEAEASFSDSGDTCDDDDSFGVQSTEAISVGQDVTVSGFLDITDYASGVASESVILDDTVLTVPAANGPSAGAGQSVSSVSGPGAVRSGDDWEFDLAGTTPQD